MSDLELVKIDESYTLIKGNSQTLKAISDFLKVERPGAFFEPAVKSGFKSPYHYFTKLMNKDLLVLNGHLNLLHNWGITGYDTKSEFTEAEFDGFYNTIKEKLPFEPYDYQLKVVKESILTGKQIALLCTSSGKSFSIALMAEFYRQKGLRGLLLVPNINLLTQFHSDIESYNLKELHEDTFLIGGGQTERSFDKSLTISTWQSLQEKYTKDLDFNKLDYIIGDEVHRLAADVPNNVIKVSGKCKYKFGFTGTLPEDPIMKMELLGLFGYPKKYISSRELIERGLGCPVNIKTIQLDYSEADKRFFNSITATGRSKNKYPNQLNFIKEHPQRKDFVNSLIIKLRQKGNMLVLFGHTEHGKDIFRDLYMILHNKEVENKDITGRKSFEFQKEYGIYFLNGEDNAKTREMTRNILEKDNNAILVGNTALLSTGVNIKQLHTLVMASPMKAYTTVTQSIGRLMRLHENKTEANVIDIVDNFGLRKPGGPFFKQYQHRLATSYHPEEFPITEMIYGFS